MGLCQNIVAYSTKKTKNCLEIMIENTFLTGLQKFNATLLGV
jgi:hypothetical protein